MTRGKIKKDFVLMEEEAPMEMENCQAEGNHNRQRIRISLIRLREEYQW